MCLYFTCITGVYISLNNREAQPDNGMIFITQIGTSSLLNQLMCSSDKMPCCLDLQPYGGWYFPNGTSVVDITDMVTLPSSFYTDRNDNGEINLYRTNNNTLSPTGHFCCKISDAMDTDHSLCIFVGEFLNSYQISIKIIIIVNFTLSIQLYISTSNHC